MSQVGKGIESHLFWLSDALWHKEVRKNMRRFVTYIDDPNHDTSSIWQDLESESVQDEIFGYRPVGTALKKCRQAALRLAYIKNVYPKHLTQLRSAGEKIFNMDKVYFHAFRQYAGKWRVPNPGSSKQVVPVTGFVLFLTSLARTASFQTPEENINFKQFQHGSAKNLQLQGAFSKLRGNSGRETKPQDGFAEFEDIRFLFRTIRDARTIYDGKRFENFSFLTTADAGGSTFQMASYFFVIGKATSLKYLKPGHGYPAEMRTLEIEDKTERQKFLVHSDILAQNTEPMGESIQKFFQLAERTTSLKKEHFIAALVRWPLDHHPQIVYVKYLGKEEPNGLNEFAMLAYMNTRKKVPVKDLKESFPNFAAGCKHVVVHENSAYFMQYLWPEEQFSTTLSRDGLNGWINNKNLTLVKPYFEVNEDARRLYTSTDPAKDFCEIYNAPESRWFLLEGEGDFVAIGSLSVSFYVQKVYQKLAASKQARVIARGGKIPKAQEVCGILLTQYSGVVLSGSKKSKIKLDNKVSGWSYVDEEQITLVKP